MRLAVLLSCGLAAFCGAGGGERALHGAGGGEGAIAPIIDARLGLLLGGAAGDRWVPAAEVAAEIEDDRAYQGYTAARVAGVGTAGAPRVRGPCGSHVVTLTPAVEEVVIAVGGDWNALPRLPEWVGPGSPVDRAAVEDFLRARGASEPDVRIERIERVDLDGNGTTEVLVAATRSEGGPGDYSLVLLRRSEAARSPLPLAVEIAAAGGLLAARHELVGAFDLNGDGRMEVVVRTRRGERAATAVFELEEAGARRVLSAGCGA